MKITKTAKGYTAVIRVGERSVRVTESTKEMVMEKALEMQKEPIDLSPVKECMRRYIELKEPVLSPSTIRSYRGILANHVENNKIGRVKINKLTNPSLQEWVKYLSGAVSPKTAQNCIGLMTATIAMFYPSFRMRISKPAKSDPEEYTPSSEEIVQVLGLFKDDMEMTKAVLLAAFCTMRRGEICGLMGEDIQGTTISIKRSMVKTKVGYTMKLPKTRKSVRTIETTHGIIDLLPKDGMVVSLTPEAITHRWERIMDRYVKAGGNRFRFHDLRAYSASLMVAVGCAKSTVRHQGGWVTDVAERFYTRPISNEIEKDMQKYLSHVVNLLENYAIVKNVEK